MDEFARELDMQYSLHIHNIIVIVLFSIPNYFAICKTVILIIRKNYNSCGSGLL